MKTGSMNFRTRLLALVAGASLLAVSSGAALADVSAEEAAKTVTDTFGVEVLDTRPGFLDTRRVWLVRAMRGADAGSGAFSVTTLAVDQQTGELAPAYFNTVNGAVEPGNFMRNDKVGRRPEGIRAGAWR